MGAIEVGLSLLKAWRNTLWRWWALPLGLVILLVEDAIFSVRVVEGLQHVSLPGRFVPPIGVVLGVAIVLLRTNTKNISAKREATSATTGTASNGTISPFSPAPNGPFPDGETPPGENRSIEEERRGPPYIHEERGYLITEPRSFILPKEGFDPKRCADKAAINEQLGRYAVADGVSRSFLPAQWAEILVTGFVGQQSDFSKPVEFVNWLLACSNEWGVGAEQWIHEARQTPLNEDWESKLLEEGAQATFVGCWLTTNGGSNTIAHVLAVGDANFFLFRPQTVSSLWQCCVAYPWEKPEDFSAITDTLSTLSRRIQRVTELVKFAKFVTQPGDRIVLATDALAHWMLTPAGQAYWNEMLQITVTSQFGELVQRERQRRALEVDDTTMLVIPVH